MPRRRNTLLQALSDPTKNFLSFFFVSVLLFNLFSNEFTGLFQDTISPWLQKTLNIPLKPETFRLLVVSLLMGITLFVIYFTDLANWIRRSLAKLGIADAVVPDIAKVSDLTKTCRGLVVIMSLKNNGKTPAEIAIRHHRQHFEPPSLEYCWMICTADSAAAARQLEQKFIDDRIAEHMVFYHSDYQKIPDPIHPHQTLSLTVNDDDIHDPDVILHLVNGIYAHAESLGVAEADMIVDITGGTKPLGIGAFLACVRPERRLEYITLKNGISKLVELRVAYRLRPMK